MSTERPEHLELRKVLVELEAIICALQTHELDELQLQAFKIDMERISVDGTSGRTPSFFAVTHPRFPEPDDDRLEDIWSALDYEDPCFTEPVDRARELEICWHSYTRSIFIQREDMPWSRKPVLDYTPYKSVYGYDQPEFGTFMMTDIPGGKFPHTMSVIYNNLDGKNRQILRGELLIILRLMLGQYRKRRFLNHMIVPVLIFSFMGKHGRIIEAHFDGRRLVLGCTDLYNFREQTSTALKDFAEWYHSDPVGDTA